MKVNADKCTGCRACELACSAFHAVPKYSSANPARSRIRVFFDELKDEYVPVYASEYALAQCNGRQVLTIGGKEYSLCTFCGASCPSRDLFKEPDSGLPLKCDMCEDDPTLPQPMCVQACVPGALTYEVTEVEGEEEKREEIEMGLESLVKKHGLRKVEDAVSRMTKS